MKNLIIANTSPAGTTPGGQRTYLAEAAITSKFLFGQQGTAANEINLAGSGDTTSGARAIGVITDEGGEHDPVNVALLGATGSTMKVTAGGSISVGDLLTSNADSKARDYSDLTAGTYHIYGIALTAAASGELVEFLPTIGLEKTKS